MNVDKKMSHLEFVNREYNKSHLSYEREMAFFNSVKEGNAEEVKRLFKPLDSNRLGKLSEDELRNLKYHLVITVAFITRYCIEGGMEMETAFNISDIYIQSVDRCKTKEEIRLLHRELVDDFTQRMILVRKREIYPKPIVLCIDYIYNNLHTKITLDTLSGIAGISPTYLSKLFHKEVGVKVSDYIMKKRVETAENMLKYSDYTCIEISGCLCFSSESHFIQVFKKYTGYTPKRYRERFFRTSR